MWTCAQCGQKNPVHALFCENCGGMRAGVQPLPSQDEAPPVEAAAAPKAPEEPVPPPLSPEPPGCGFLLGWTAATAGAETVAGIVLHILYRIYYGLVRPGSEDMASAALMGVFAALTVGVAVGGAQTLTLSLSVTGRRWTAWWLATLAAWFLGCLVLFPIYQATGVFRGEGFAVRVVGGALFGACVGAAQVFVLQRTVPAGGRIIWILVNVLSYVTTNALQQMLIAQQPFRGCAAALLPLWGLISGTLHGLVTGIALTALLRQAARGPAPAPPPLTPPAAG